MIFGMVIVQQAKKSTVHAHSFKVGRVDRTAPEDIVEISVVPCLNREWKSFESCLVSGDAYEHVRALDEE